MKQTKIENVARCAQAIELRVRIQTDQSRTYESFDEFTVGQGCPTYGEDGSDIDV